MVVIVTEDWNIWTVNAVTYTSTLEKISDSKFCVDFNRQGLFRR